MSTSGDQTSSRTRLIYLILCTFVSFAVFSMSLWRPSIDNYHRARVIEMVYGDAHRPYVYRTLLPTVTRLVVSAVPAETREHLRDTWGRTAAMDNLFRILSWDQDYFLEYIVVAALLYLALWGFVVSARSLFSAVYAAPPVVRDVFALAVLAGVPQLFWNTNYIYDFPQLFLFTLGLALMARRRWGAYLIVFTFGCLNKETTILLTLVFVIHFWSRVVRPRRFRSLVLIQLAAFAAIKIGLTAVFRDNPGGVVEFHLADRNLDYLLRPVPLATAFAWFGFVLFLFYDWRAKPELLRHAVWIVIPLFVLAVFMGFYGELRIYYEAYPVIMLLLVHSVSRVWKFELRNRTEPLAAR